MTKRSFIHRERNLHRMGTVLGQDEEADQAVLPNSLVSTLLMKIPITVSTRTYDARH